MKKSLLSRFWDAHDIQTDKHSEHFLKELVDQKKNLFATSERVQKFSYLCLLLFWLLALQQSPTVTFLNLQFSNPPVLLTLLMVILSYLTYHSTVIALHILAIEQVLSSYYERWLPAAKLLNLNSLLTSTPSEIGLGSVGILKKWKALFFGFLHILTYASLLMGLTILTIWWVAQKVSFSHSDWIRVCAICLAIFLSLRAILMFSECLGILTKSEWESAMAKNVSKKAESTSAVNPSRSNETASLPSAKRDSDPTASHSA